MRLIGTARLPDVSSGVQGGCRDRDQRVRTSNGPAPIPRGVHSGVAAGLQVRHVGFGWGMPTSCLTPATIKSNQVDARIRDSINLCGRLSSVLAANEMSLCTR